MPAINNETLIEALEDLTLTHEEITETDILFDTSFED